MTIPDLQLVALLFIVSIYSLATRLALPLYQSNITEKTKLKSRKFKIKTKVITNF